MYEIIITAYFLKLKLSYCNISMIIISTQQINTGTIEITHKERDIYFHGYYLNSRQCKYWKTRSIMQ